LSSNSKHILRVEDKISFKYNKKYANTKRFCKFNTSQLFRTNNDLSTKEDNVSPRNRRDEGFSDVTINENERLIFARGKTEAEQINNMFSPPCLVFQLHAEKPRKPQ
jgi:hypothetical protein